MTTSLVAKEPDALIFFSPIAFRFFLPGYLILALEDPEGMDLALNTLLSTLAGPYQKEENLGLLNQAQLEITLEVLEALEPDREDPLYWDVEKAKEVVLDFLTRPAPLVE